MSTIDVYICLAALIFQYLVATHFCPIFLPFILRYSKNHLTEKLNDVFKIPSTFTVALKMGRL